MNDRVRPQPRIDIEALLKAASDVSDGIPDSRDPLIDAEAVKDAHVDDLSGTEDDSQFGFDDPVSGGIGSSLGQEEVVVRADDYVLEEISDNEESTLDSVIETESNNEVEPIHTGAIEVDETELTSGGIDKATRTQPRQPKPRGRANSAGTRSRGVGGNTKEKEKLAPDEDSVRQYLKEIGQYPLLTKEDEVRLAQKMEAGLAAKYRMESSDNLSPSELRKLRRAVRDGDRAKQQFINSNLRLVVSIAKKYQASGMPLLDLTQEGNFGLMHAVEKFDWQKGFKFSTYATWWIRQAITRGIANTGRTIRLPVHAGDTIARINKTSQLLERRNGVEPSLNELASELGMPVEKVAELMIYRGDAISLDEPVREDGDAELGDLVPDSRSNEGYEAVEAADRALKLRENLLIVLDEREATIIELHFGLDREDGRSRTLEEVGEYFNLTRERIRQIEARAMTKLRHPSASGVMEALRDIG